VQNTQMMMNGAAELKIILYVALITCTLSLTLHNFYLFDCLLIKFSSHDDVPNIFALILAATRRAFSSTFNNEEI
jgi:hypothetical protein